MPDKPSGSLLRQFQCATPVDVLVHHCIQEVPKQEWKNPDKIIKLSFLEKLYPLKDILKDLPDSIPVDSFVASLMGHTSLAEDAIIRDSVDKKMDVALKKGFFGANLALRAGVCGTHVAQSLVCDMKFLCRALDDCSGVLEHIEHQVEFLSDVSFEVVQASALSGVLCVAVQCNLVLRDWTTDAAHQSNALWMPSHGSV
ncbi:hypothetical protein NDU88_003143 [Pleurodeles waltl]|uniref:Uncharacterized protein n=1 Tax=Pleurodeles waltl TaxID=8319 RepID=A0AAV7NNW5_PLEWA|nr:hypothetical protein NDU88_003143 [Pleurodeles waltl]